MSTTFTEFTFHWEPPPEVIAGELDAIAVLLYQMYPPLALSRDVYIEGIERAFASKVAPGGAAWAPWSEDYAFYAQNVNVGGLMERTDALKGAVTSPSAYSIGANEVFYTGAGLPDYAGFHLSGTSKMPARPFVGMDDETVHGIEAVWVAWFNEVVEW